MSYGIILNALLVSPHPIGEKFPALMAQWCPKFCERRVMGFRPFDQSLAQDVDTAL